MAEGKNTSDQGEEVIDEGVVSQEGPTQEEPPCSEEEETPPAESAAEGGREQQHEQEEPSESGPESETAAEEEPTPEKVIRQLEAQVADLTDKHLRAVAELDNYRKRARRERQEALRYAPSGLMVALLPVIDNFERALGASAETGEVAGLVEGVELILKQFSQALENHGLSPIAALNEQFDPTKHEALGQVPVADVEPGTIVQEVQKGYSLHDRVLRATQVFVAAEPPDVEGEGTPPDEESADADSEDLEHEADDASSVTDPIPEEGDGSGETAGDA